MSIIYDALKKVEETHKPEIGKEQKPKRKTYSSYGLALCAGLIIAGASFTFFAFFYENLSKSEWDDMEKQNIVIPAPGPGDLSRALPAPEPTPPSFPEAGGQPGSSLVLNGIFFSENEGYALINNQIVREGDTINGATIKEIGLNEVKLEVEDSVFTLSSSR